LGFYRYPKSLRNYLEQSVDSTTFFPVLGFFINPII